MSNGFTSTLRTSSRSATSRDSDSSTSRDGGAIDGGVAADLTEERSALEVVEHLLAVHRGDRHEAERDVGDGLGEHAADPGHDARPELGVAVHAHDQLAGAAHHRSDQHLHVAVVGPSRGQQLRDRACHDVLAVEAAGGRGRAPTCG